MNRFKPVSDGKRIEDLFRNLARRNCISVIITIRNKRQIAEMSFSARRGTQPSIICPDNEKIEINAGEEMSVSFSDSEFTVFFKTAAVSSAIGNSFDIQKPLVVYTGFKNLPVQYSFTDLSFLKDIDSSTIDSIINGSVDGGNGKVPGYSLEKVKNSKLIFAGFSYRACEIDTAFGTALRIYPETFMGQPAVCRIEEKFNPKAWTQIYGGIAGYLYLHPGCENLIMYLPAACQWQTESMSAIERFVGNRSRFLIDAGYGYICDTSSLMNYDTKQEYNCEAINDCEDFLKYCAGNLEPLIIKALSYDQDSFFLDEIRQVYKADGYITERSLYCVKKEENIIAFAVAESSSDIFNFNIFHDVCRLYCVNKDSDTERIAAAVLPEIAPFFHERGKESFYLLLDAGEESKSRFHLKGVDFKDKYACMFMNREGIREYKKLLKDNFIDFNRYSKLTYPQLSIWHTEMVFPNTGFGNIAGTARINGEVDFELLENAINQVVRENDSYRIRIEEGEGIEKQYFAEYRYFKVEFFDFSGAGANEEYGKWSSFKTVEPFDLHNSDLYYFALFKISENEGGFFYKTHHLISDAWTGVTQISKIMEYYSRFRNDMKIIPESNPSYIDFVTAEEEYLESKRFDEHKRFWSEKFSTVPEFLSFKTRGAVYKNLKASRKSIKISHELAVNIHEFCISNKQSPFITFLSILYIFISRITSKSDIVLGTPVLNRTNAREKRMTGMFINILPVRYAVDCEQSLISFADALSKEWITLLRNQKYPYELIQKEFRERHQITDSLSDVVLSYQNVKLDRDEFTEDYELSWHFCGYQTNSLQIHVRDWDDTGTYVLDFDYLEDVFGTDEIERMSRYFVNLLKEAVSHPREKLSKMNILPETETKQVLYDFNDTDKDYPRDKTIIQLFEIQADKNFNNIAVEFNNKKLTYKELNIRANSLASILREKGVKSDSIVGISMDRSVELVIGILGILKAGGAYLPINPKYPAARIDYILKDSGTQILLINGSLNGSIDFEGEILDMGTVQLNTYEQDNPVNINKPEDLAYVIYTSGSTGEPKGVMIEHRSLVNFLYSMYEMYDCDFNAGDRCLSLTNISFDASVCEIFMPLVFGACLVLNSDSDYLDVVKLSEIIVQKSINFTYIPPSMLKELSRLLKKYPDRVKLDKMFVGAEPIKVSVMAEYLSINPCMKILNGYGPTETTIVASFYPFSLEEDKESCILIGKPVNNTKIYILDKEMLPVPVNVTGEIYIAGDCLARGYLNNSEATGKKFVHNPFSGGRMYRSGDHARWLPDGNIQFIGRADNQVKIRGLRIELGEIENLLSKMSCITATAVIAKQDEEGNKYLCAYFTATENLSKNEITAHLLKFMPEYMVPGFFIQLAEMPLTYNGKINKLLLPEPDRQNNVNKDFSPPSNEVEENLLKAWQKVLKITGIGVKDNLFEYGIDSLTIMRVLVEVLEYGWNVAMQDFYRYPTIESMADIIMFKNPGAAYEESPAADQNISLQGKTSPVTDYKKRKYKNVLLTGATGFLGAHILKSLLDGTQADIFCLVRAESMDLAANKLIEKLQFYFGGRYDSLLNNRIIVVNGDITCERFGLDIQGYEELIKKIDTVIHSAAIVKHFGDYSLFEKTNIVGTQRMLEFCISSGAKLNYISTVSISGDFFKQRSDNLIFTENDLFIGQNFDGNVYVKSKFEAEKLIFQYSGNSLNASIFRIGNLTGRYDDGHFQPNISENRFYGILNFFIQSGAVSKDICRLKAEFTPVDICSEAIVKLAELDMDRLSIFHLFNDKKIEIRNIIQVFRFVGCKIDLLDNEQYGSRMADLLKSGDTKEMMVNIINDLHKEGTFGLKPSVAVNSEITKGYLKPAGLEWPDFNAGYIYKIYRYMKKAGFIT